jgi:hypothetical protein
MKTLSFFTFLLFLNFPSQNTKTIQFDIRKILNARPVSTLNNKHITTWTKGIDGGGFGDGYLTLSAALFNGDKEPHALPDNPVFAANESHPEIKLHYSNADSLNYQTCNISGADSLKFAVPQQKYKAIYLALTSSEGASQLHIVLTYKTGDVNKEITLPDYYADLNPSDKSLGYLAHDLAKWGNKNNMTEKDHHNIDLLKIETDPGKILKSITIKKDKAGYLVFWAAAGETLK